MAEIRLSVTECSYGWTAAYEQLGASISVRIRLDRDPDVTEEELADAKLRWATGIHTKWNSRFACCDNPGAQTVADCTRVRGLSFDVQWVTNDPHHIVSVHRGPGRGTNMLHWFHDDSGDIAAHEFGHMLRNLDEYFDSGCPGRSPINTGTVMHVLTGPVARRHVVFLCDQLGEGTVLA